MVIFGRFRPSLERHATFGIDLMTRTDQVKEWLLVPCLHGRAAALCVVAAIIVPTMIRLAVDGIVTESGFLPYLPFVLLAAILLDSRHGVAVVTGSAVVADLLFVGPRFQFLEGADDIFGFVAFLISSSLIVGLVQTVRTAVSEATPSPKELGGGVLFSLEDGEAWAKSSRNDSSVRLGPQEEVAGMMADFLAQLEVGKRLNG